MLRSTLRVDTELIRLRDEIQYIRSFISILTICYGNRVQFRIIHDDINDHILIPKLLLQPLIENAVKYSLGIVEVSVISITLRETAEGLTIMIKDNGVGIPDSVLKDLSAGPEAGFLQDVLDIGEKGIGLKNVIARGRIYYGAQFSFRVDSIIGQGTEITMILPIKG
jgi:two-component system sensor histidine kinase YesM